MLIWFSNFLGCSTETTQAALEIYRRARGSQNLFNGPQQLRDSKKGIMRENASPRQASQQESAQQELFAEQSAHSSANNIPQQVYAPGNLLAADIKLKLISWLRTLTSEKSRPSRLLRREPIRVLGRRMLEKRIKCFKISGIVDLLAP